MGHFDPYYVWLGIPPEEQPPHLYRLLGVPLYEKNLDVIRNAADRQMTFVREQAIGEYQKVSQQILNELSSARVTLLNPQKKAKYDEDLRIAQEQAAGESATGTSSQDDWLSDSDDAGLDDLPIKTRKRKKKKAPDRPPEGLNERSKTLLLIAGGAVAGVLMLGLGWYVAATILTPSAENADVTPIDDVPVASSTFNTPDQNRVGTEQSNVSAPGSSPESPPDRPVQPTLPVMAANQPSTTLPGPAPGPAIPPPPPVPEGYLRQVEELPLFERDVNSQTLADLELQAEETGSLSSAHHFLDSFTLLCPNADPQLAKLRKELDSRMQSPTVGGTGAASAAVLDADLNAALAYISRRDPGEARKQLERIKNQHDADPRAPFLLGLLSVITNDGNSATATSSAFRTAIVRLEKSGVTSPEAMNNLALSKFQEGDKGHGEAVRTWEAMKELAPRERALSQNLGRILDDNKVTMGGLTKLGVRETFLKKIQDLYDSAVAAGAPPYRRGGGWVYMSLPWTSTAGAVTAGESEVPHSIVAVTSESGRLIAPTRQIHSARLAVGDRLKDVKTQAEYQIDSLTGNGEVTLLAARGLVSPPATKSWSSWVPGLDQELTIHPADQTSPVPAKILGRTSTGLLVLNCGSSCPEPGNVVTDSNDDPVGVIVAAFRLLTSEDGCLAVMVPSTELRKISSRSSANLAGSEIPRAETYEHLRGSGSAPGPTLLNLGQITLPLFSMSGQYLEDHRCSHCSGQGVRDCLDPKCNLGRVPGVKQQTEVVLGQTVTKTLPTTYDCTRCQNGFIDCPFCNGGRE